MILKTAGYRINTALKKMKTRLLQSFKSLHFGVYIAAILTVLAIGFTACTNDDEKIPEKPASVLSEYFAIQNATIVSGTIPSNPNGPSIGEVTINSTVIAGGSSQVSIATEQNIQKIYVSVKGSNHYYVITPAQLKGTVLDFIILLSQGLNKSFDIQISGLLGDGTTTSLYQSGVTFHAAGTGGLQVSLSFNNEKDVDLYVIQPDGDIIYYGNKGGTIWDSVTNTYVYWWGLDLDSNPGCSIDSINNENVFYPSSLIQTGTYQVWVNMYSNCDPSIPTSCVVTALESGQLITPIYGVNPSTNVFPIGEPSNSISSDTTGALKVMEFTITGTPTTPKKVYNTPLTQSAKMKLQRAKRR